MEESPTASKRLISLDPTALSPSDHERVIVTEGMPSLLAQAVPEVARAAPARHSIKCQLGTPIHWAVLFISAFALLFRYTRDEPSVAFQASRAFIQQLVDARVARVIAAGSGEFDIGTIVPATYCPNLSPFNFLTASNSHFLSSMAVDREVWQSFIAARVYCIPSKMKYAEGTYPLCVYDPDVDGGLSRQLIYSGQVLSQREVSYLHHVGPCTPTRSVFIDVGAGVGAVSVLAGAAGCQVIAFEPITANMGRLLRNLKDNGVMRNTTVYKNVVSGSRGAVWVQFDQTDSMKSLISDRVPVGDEAVGSLEVAGAVALDDFFVYPGRPDCLSAQRLVQPTDINVIWLDTGTLTLSGMHGMNNMIQAGRVPFIRVTLRAGPADAYPGCSTASFLTHMSVLGYAVVIDGTHVAYASVLQWLRGAERDMDASKQSKRGRPDTNTGPLPQTASPLPSLDLWFVLPEAAASRSGTSTSATSGSDSMSTEWEAWVPPSSGGKARPQAARGAPARHAKARRAITNFRKNAAE